jgi:hypothetical protein
VSSLSCLPNYRHQHPIVLNVVTLSALAFVGCCAWLSWSAFRACPSGTTIDGGRPWDRARFMALLGVLLSLLFIAAIIALAMPVWMLRGVCD